MKLSTIRSESVTPNSFIGRFKAQSLNVSRTHNGAEWQFIVMTRDGIPTASGKASGDLLMREAIHQALIAAGLVKAKV